MQTYNPGKFTGSRYRMDGDLTRRGPIDRNFLYADQSVAAFRDLAFDDPRMREVPTQRMGTLSTTTPNAFLPPGPPG